MAVQFLTTQPQPLLAAFDARIHQREAKGKITTWEALVHKGVTYYTHTAQQWHRKAYFRPSIENGQLAFYIIKPENQALDIVVYAYYHGHLSETFITHFNAMFSHAVCTATAINGDVVS